MKERQLSSLFKKSCAADGFMYVDIPDGAGMVGAPMDGILCYGGRFVGIEHKRHTCFKAFHPRELRDNQVRGLNACEASGGTAVVTLMIWIPNKTNIIMWWDWNEFKYLTNDLTTSIKKADIEARAFATMTNKKYHLDSFYEFLDTQLL